MANAQLTEQRQNALRTVEAVLGELGLYPRPLHLYDLKAYDRLFTAGWAIWWTFSDGIKRKLYILTDSDYPYSLPRIAVVDPMPEVLSWPHLENKGLLCIWDADTSASSYNPAQVVREILADAVELIEDSIHGRNREDFLSEFFSYWIYRVNRRDFLQMSLVSLQGPSRLIQVWKGKGFDLFSDDEELAKRWMRRSGIAESRKGYHAAEALFCWFPRALYPEEYPLHGNGLAKLLRDLDNDGFRLMAEQLGKGQRGFDLLLGFESSTGKGVVPVSFGCQMQGRAWPGGAPVDYIQKGFRQGQVPPHIAIGRALTKKVPVLRGMVDRVDAAWIHGRDHNPNIGLLQTRTVVILGCGSLGSYVARSLAQAGIGNFILFDPDYFSRENTSRHQLGASVLFQKNRNKAQLLKENLEADFPHLGKVIAKDTTLSAANSGLWELVSGADLIISATGDWQSDCQLNVYQQTAAHFPAILYSWMEDNAAAAHAVLIGPGQAGCLQCGFHHNGLSKLTITQWSEAKKRKPVPACAATFSEFGPIELAMSQALVADLALKTLLGQTQPNLHRYWFCSANDLQAKGGSVNPEWVERQTQPNLDSHTSEMAWMPDPYCPVCSPQAVHAVV